MGFIVFSFVNILFVYYLLIFYLLIFYLFIFLFVELAGILLLHIRFFDMQRFLTKLLLFFSP